MSNIRQEFRTLRERHRLVKQLRKYRFKESQNQQLQYTYHSPILVKFWVIWKVLILLVDLYLINECYLWICFQSFYQFSLSQLLPLAIVFLILLLINIVFRIFMTPRLPAQLILGLSKKSQFILQFQHYCCYEYNGWQILIDIVFFISYLIPYQQAKYIHLVYAFKIVVMHSWASDVYSQIHTITFLRIFYHLFVLFFLIIYLSHFLGCIFYVIDQSLIDSQYFGDPISNPNSYYQFNSQAFTPIQMLNDFERYVMALYFANGLVITIAYGDIVGLNYIQDAYVGSLMIVSTIVIAFLLEQFINMLKDNSFQVFQIIKRFRYLRLAMKLKNVSTELQIRIRNYIFYIEYYEKFNNPQQVLEKLSNKMHLDLSQAGYGKYLTPIFTPLGISDIRTVCKYLQEVTYQPEIDIFTNQPKQIVVQGKQHSVDISILQPSFLFILQGKAYQYLRWNSESKEFRFRQGLKNVNFYEFFTQTRVRFGFRSKYVLKAVLLSHEDLVQILSQQQQSFKKLKAQKEQVLSYGIARSKFQDACDICNQKDHSIFTCPSIFYVIHQHIGEAEKISTILYDKVNLRKDKSRKNIKSVKKINTLHYSVVLQKFNFFSLFQAHYQQAESEQVEDIGASLIQKMLKDICEKTSTSLPEQGISADSCYDQQGLDPRWAL